MNSETPVKDILDGEVEAENTVEIETVEDTVEEQPAANDEVVAEEIVETTEAVEEAEKKVEKKVEKVVYSPAVEGMASGKALVPFIIGFASVCLMAIGYLLMWIFNLAAPNVGAFSNTYIIKSFFGRFMASLVHSVIFAFAIVAIVAFVKILVNGKAGLSKNLKNINLLNKGMHAFAMFSVIDMGVICFITILKHNHWIIAKTLGFMGYAGLGYDKRLKTLEDPEKGGLVISIIYALLCVAAPVVLVLAYNAIKDYIKKLENSANGAQFDKGNKAPFVFAFIAAGVNFAFAIVSFISGVYVDGVIFLANTAYMVANALYVMSIHKDMLQTSFE